jgi:hypothetical protein
VYLKQISRFSNSQGEFATILVPPGYLPKRLPFFSSAARNLHFYPRVSLRAKFYLVLCPADDVTSQQTWQAKTLRLQAAATVS